MNIKSAIDYGGILGGNLQNMSGNIGLNFNLFKVLNIKQGNVYCLNNYFFRKAVLQISFLDGIFLISLLY